MTNEQLLMLDSMVYFSKFSNDFTPNNGVYKTVGEFVKSALEKPAENSVFHN